MGKQFIISVGREYGSGGHEIGRKLANAFGIHLYDRSLLDEFAAMQGVDPTELFKYDEVPRRPFFSRTVRGYTNSPEVNIAELQFELLRKKADSGESFVVVGRCADTILRGNEGLISIFVHADYEAKIERVITHRNRSRKEAMATIERHDKNRKAYHNRMCGGMWGETKNYDICINSSKLGIDGTVEFLKVYIEKILESRG